MNPLELVSRRARTSAPSFVDPRARIASATSVLRVRAEDGERLANHGEDVLARTEAALSRLEAVALKLEAQAA